MCLIVRGGVNLIYCGIGNIYNADLPDKFKSYSDEKTNLDSLTNLPVRYHNRLE